MTVPDTLRFESSQRRIIHRHGLLAVGLLVGFLLSPQPALAEELAPEQVAKLLDFNPQSTLVVTHWRWRALFKYYVKGAGDGKFLINYWGQGRGGTHGGRQGPSTGVELVEAIFDEIKRKWRSRLRSPPP